MCHDVEEKWWKYQLKAIKTLHHIVLQLYQILRVNYLLRNCVEEGWLPDPFLKITSRSFTMLKTSLPLRCIDFVRWSAWPLKCLPFFRTGCLMGRNRRWPMYTIFLQWVNHILSVSSKQSVHALYLLFECPDKLLRACQSLIVTNSNARRLKFSCLYSSHIRTPSL